MSIRCIGLGVLSFFQFLQGLGDDRALFCDRAPPEALFRKAIPPGHTDPVVRAVQHSKVLRAGETGDQQQQQQCLRWECIFGKILLLNITQPIIITTITFLSHIKKMIQNGKIK